MDGRQKKFIMELQRKAKLRRESGLFTVDGARMAGELSPSDAEQIFVTNEFLSSDNAGFCEDLLRARGFEVISQSDMKQISDTVTPQGILVLAKQRRIRGLKELFELGADAGDGKTDGSVEAAVALHNTSEARAMAPHNILQARAADPHSTPETRAMAQDNTSEANGEPRHHISPASALSYKAAAQTPGGVSDINYRYAECSGAVSHDKNDACIERTSFKRPPLVLILETIQDPGNLGTIIRTAEAAGVTGIVMNRETVDVYSPKVVRSTMGALMRVPFLVVEDLIKAAGAISAGEFTGGSPVRLYAARLDCSNDYTEADYTGACAVMIGNEGNGLSAELSSRADAGIFIPMLGKTESLNAAVAASVIAFEAARQRRASAEVGR